MATTLAAMTQVAGAGSGHPATPVAGQARSGARRGRWSARLTRRDPVLLAVTASGGALRVWGLGAQSYWYDEWLTARAAAGGPRDLYRYVTDQAGIPPTYFVVTWLWARAFGTGEIALRSVSVAAGVAAIVVTYHAALALEQSRTVARLAAALVAVNPVLVWYSQEARPYSLVALLVAGSLLTAGRYVRSGGRAALAAWGAVAAATIAVHYYAVFLVAIEAAWLVAVRRPASRDARRALVPAAVILALLAPFAVRQFGRRGNHSWIGGFDLDDRARDAGRSLLAGPTVPDARLWTVAGLAAAVLVGVALVTAPRSGRRALAAFAGLGLGAAALALAAALVGLDDFLARYLVGSVIPLVLALAVAAVAVRPRGLAAAGLVVVAAVWLTTVVAVQTTPALQRADWRAVADAFGEPLPAAGSGRRLLVVDRGPTMALPVTWYLDDARTVDDGEGVVVDQIDVLTAVRSDTPCNLLVGTSCGFIFLGGPLRGAADGPFVEVGRIDLDQFALVRYRSDQPVRVSPADFGAERRDWVPLLLVTGDRHRT